MYMEQFVPPLNLRILAKDAAFQRMEAAILNTSRDAITGSHMVDKMAASMPPTLLLADIQILRFVQ